MTANLDIIKKNIGTFVNAYGLEVDYEKVFAWLRQNRGEIQNIGVLLYNPENKEPAIYCQFPIDRDVSDNMLWVASDNRDLQAAPTGTRKVNGDYSQRPSLRMNGILDNEEFLTVREEDFILQIHNSFKKEGILDRYHSTEGKGWIRRTHKGIYFRKEWCSENALLATGMNVTFLPIISRFGIQARAVEESQ